MSAIIDHWKAGYWSLQDPNFAKQGLQLHDRAFMAAVRIQDRPADGQSIGQYEIEEGSAGDIIGGFLWKRNSGALVLADVADLAAGTRKIPAWAFAWPTVLKLEGAAAVLLSEGLAVSGKDTGGKLPVAYPILDGRWTADTRFKRELPTFSKAWPLFPEDTYGIVLDSTLESKQIPLWFHCDPRLVAVNIAGDPAMASIVCDLDSEGRYDPRRRARLHSFLRVVLPKSGCVPFKNGLGGALAWQLGRAGRDGIEGLGLGYDTAGGFASAAEPIKVTPSQPTNSLPDDRQTVALPSGLLVTRPSYPQGRGTKGTLGAFGRQGGGPLHTGGPSDQHKIAETEDGEDINSGHIRTGGYFLGHGGDAPLAFEEKIWRRPPKGTIPIEVSGFQLDPLTKHPHPCGERDGLWRQVAYMPSSTGFGKMFAERTYLVPSGIRDAAPPETETWGGGFKVEAHDDTLDTGLCRQFKLQPKPMVDVNMLRLVVYLSPGTDFTSGIVEFAWDQQAAGIGTFEPTTFGTAKLALDGSTTPLKAGIKYALAHNVTPSSPIWPVDVCQEFYWAFSRLADTGVDTWGGSIKVHNVFLIWDVSANVPFTGPIATDSYTFPLLDGVK